MLFIDHSCTLNAPLKFYASSVTNDTIVARDNGRWSVVCLCNTCYQELTMVRELIPHIGFIPKVIRVKLFLDMVPTSSVNISRRICLCFLYKAKENLQRCEDAFFDISISKKAKKQGKIHESWSFHAFVCGERQRNVPSIKAHNLCACCCCCCGLLVILLLLSISSVTRCHIRPHMRGGNGIIVFKGAQSRYFELFWPHTKLHLNGRKPENNSLKR